MIEVEPRRDELCLSHKGRIAWINGCSLGKETNDLIQHALNDKGIDTSHMPQLHQLALVSKLTTTDYARQHSMLPVLRVAAKLDTELLHGALSAPSYSRRLGMLTQRGVACCCVQCIEDDLEHWHFSWFRRTHHLIGVDWCPIHGCALSTVDAPNPFSLVPHIWLADGKLKPFVACSSKLPEEGFLRRYVEVATRLLGREKPLHARKVNERLAQRAKALDLRISVTGQRPLISDRLSDLAPDNWLQQHVVGWKTKTHLNFLQRIDGLASSKTLAGTGDAYAIAMAVLYDSGEQAMLDVASTEATDIPINGQRNAFRRGTQFWQGGIWQHYLDSGGKIKGMAERLNIGVSFLGDMMIEIGLPSLHDVDRSPKWRAFVRFCEGQTLAESCTTEQVDLFQLEILLRRCCSRVFSALQKIGIVPKNP